MFCLVLKWYSWRWTSNPMTKSLFTFWTTFIILIIFPIIVPGVLCNYKILNYKRQTDLNIKMPFSAQWDWIKDLNATRLPQCSHRSSALTLWPRRWDCPYQGLGYLLVKKGSNSRLAWLVWILRENILKQKCRWDNWL